MQGSPHHDLLDKVRHYKMPDKAEELLNQHRPLIITGITASGQTAVMEKIQEMGYGRHVITHTTRPPRPGEVSGENYFFVSESQMLELLNSGSMIEANAVHGQNVYGVSIASYESIVQNGHKPILVIEIQGIQHLLNSGVDIRPYFLLPPSFEIWMERLEKRGAMSYSEKQRRLISARDQMEIALRDNHFILVINQDLPRTIQEILRDSFDPASQRHGHELAQRLIDHIASY